MTQIIYVTVKLQWSLDFDFSNYKTKFFEKLTNSVKITIRMHKIFILAGSFC
jgi:hypothetical protein